MAFKVFIQQIQGVNLTNQQTVNQNGNSADQTQENSVPNLNIRVKCTETQDEFRGQAYLNAQYLEKCHRWVNKGKYQCVTLNNNAEMELKVQIFKFHLRREEKTDIETLKQEICQMRKDNEKLKGELKLFRYYFLHLWRDKCRKEINQPENQEFRHQLIQNSSKLYDNVQANGLILEEFGAKTYYLTFTNQEQMNQMAQQNGSANPRDQIMMGQTPTPMGMMTPMGMTPTPGMHSMPNQAQVHQDGKRSMNDNGMTNLMDRINNFQAFVTSGDMNEQMIGNGERVNHNELEVFINGGGQGCQQYKYKKAALDFSKMQGSADGAVMLRVNCPVADGQQYNLSIPKRIGVN